MNFIRRHKKAVSPVIAVVLLIALTAAAVGVVWLLFTNFSGNQELVTITKTFSAQYDSATGVYTWKGEIDSTGKGTIDSAEWGSLTNASVSVSLVDGKTSVTIKFNATGGISGSFDTSKQQLIISCTVDGTTVTAQYEVQWTKV